MIKLKIGPQQEELEFLVDSRAERSTVQRIPFRCKLSRETALVVGAKGKPFKVEVIKDVYIETESKIGIGNFLVVPEAEFNLLGRDLIIELGISLQVENKELKIKICPLRVEDEEKINPEVWYTPDSVGQLKIAPFVVKIKNSEVPVRIK